MGRHLAFMGRHVVTSFNCQLLKASHAFQRVSPGEEEKAAAKESILHHKPAMGEAATGLMPPESMPLAVSGSWAVSNRQQRTCCRALGSPWWAQAPGDQTAPGAPWSCSGGVSVGAKDMELTSFLCTPESIPALWQPRDRVFPLQCLMLETPVGEDRETRPAYLNARCSPYHTSQG